MNTLANKDTKQEIKEFVYFYSKYGKMGVVTNRKLAKDNTTFPEFRVANPNCGPIFHIVRLKINSSLKAP